MSTETKLKILVAGGAPDVVINGNFHRHLISRGLEVGWHVGDYDGTDTFRGIPKGCQGVIIMKDMTSHPMATKVTREAKALGLSVAVVSSKWCQAEPILRIQGILPDANGSPVLSEEADILAVAQQYIERVKEMDERDPKYEELVCVIQKGFGVKAVFTPAHFGEASAKAAQVVSLPFRDVPKEPVTPTVHAPLTEEEIEHYVIDQMVENPEVRTEALVADLQKIDCSSVLPDLVDQVVVKVRARWLSKTDADQKWSKPIKAKWVLNWIRTASLLNKIPTYDEIGDRSLLIFGNKIAWALAKQARCEVWGEWADALVSAKHGQKYLDAAGYKEASLDRLLRDGQVKFMICGGKKLTSEKAIQEFLDKSMPPKAEEPSETLIDLGLGQDDVEPVRELDTIIENIFKDGHVPPPPEALLLPEEFVPDPVVPSEILLEGVDTNPIADPVLSHELPVPIPDPVVPTSIQVTATLPMALTEAMIEIKQSLRLLNVQVNESNQLLIQIRDQLRNANPGITAEEVLAKIQKATVQIIVPGLTDIRGT